MFRQKVADKDQGNQKYEATALDNVQLKVVFNLLFFFILLVLCLYQLTSRTLAYQKETQTFIIFLSFFYNICQIRLKMN